MPYSVEFRMMNAQGHYVWLLTQGSPEFGPDGDFSGFISSTIDISIQKDVEQQLNHKTRTLEFTMAAGKLGSYELEINSGRMTTSPQYNRNIGLEPGRQLTLSYLLTLIQADDKQTISRAFAGVVTTRQSYEMEYRLVRASGEVCWIRDCGIAVSDRSGNVNAVSGFTMNITEQKKLVAELERKAKDKMSDLSARFSNLDNMIS
jgi:PAS domain S-box-containing protein